MRRGFTMVELAVVVTLLTILVPLIFMLFNRGAADYQRANATLEAAEQLRDLSEELRLDGRTGALSAAGVVFEGGACAPITYRLVEASVVREAPASCGGTRALVRHAREFVRTGSVLTVRIAQLPEDPPITLVLPLGASR